jgi:hypothetical protein
MNLDVFIQELTDTIKSGTEDKNISASAPIGKIGDTYKLVFF